MFKDLKIVELAAVLAGPLTGTFFSELGAEVIKIENAKTGGDVTRGWKLPTEEEDAPVSAYYASANYGKKALVRDLKNPRHYAEVIELIREADVVIQNYKPGTAEKLLMDYDSLKIVNPNLIYASLTGYGERDFRPAFDVVLQAETGFMSMTGYPDGPPVKMPVAMIDILAAHHMKEAILCALINKLKTGEGKNIEINLFQAALASLTNQATNWLMGGHIPKRMGTQHPNIAPYGDMYLTNDKRYLVLSVGTDAQFLHLCEVLGISSEGFKDNFDRVAKRDALNAQIGKVIAEKDVRHWESHLQDHKVPFGIVKNMKEVFENPDAKACLLEEEIDGIKTVRVKTAYV